MLRNRFYFDLMKLKLDLLHTEIKLLALKTGFNPDQSRDEHGRWDGGDSGSVPADSGVNYGGDNFNASDAIDHLNEKADALKDEQINNGQPNLFGDGKCATYVREAIQAGGIPLENHPDSAKLYDPYLATQGFDKVTPTPSPNYLPYKGDIAVIQPYPGGKDSGHIQMYNGQQWVSDFRQQDFWPGAGYRQAMPDYSVFRR